MTLQFLRNESRTAERIALFPSIAASEGIDPFDPSAVRAAVAVELGANLRSCSRLSTAGYHSAVRRGSLAGC